jgi:hypothetical protein
MSKSAKWTLAFFAVMAVLHSWPLAGNPGGLARLDNDDAALNTWAITWVSHALVTNPLGLFDAPIFHPEPNTLAYSEHLFVPALMGAPLLWLGVSPVLVHNLLLLAGFTLSGWVMSLVVGRWTGSTVAGIIAGLLYAFNAHVLTRFPHLQAQHVEFFPLMLYALDRVLTRSPEHHIPRSRDLFVLSLTFVLQALCSNYLLVFMTAALLAAAAVRAGEWLPMSRTNVRNRLLIAGAASVIVLTPFLWPYYEVSRDEGLTRPVSEVARYAAGWRDYLATGGRLHYEWWSRPFFEGRTALFPGITALLLAGVAVGTGVAWRDRRARMALAIGVAGLALSFGPSLPGYAWLHEHVPLLAGIRNAARFGWLTLAAVAILAGFGASCLVPGAVGSASCLVPRARGGAVLALAALLATAEAWRAPVGFTPFTGIPRIYDRLAAESPVVLAEFPFYSGRSISDNGPYVLANTRYLQPLVNGYSGFATPAFEERGRALNSFPAGLAIAQLQVLGVTHVTVHTDAFARHLGEAALRAVDTVVALELVADEDGVRLYRLRR